VLKLPGGRVFIFVAIREEQKSSYLDSGTTLLGNLVEPIIIFTTSDGIIGVSSRT
jgi:hypothetical protein